MAILPDEAIQAEVTTFKKQLSDRFGAVHALRSPPHITLFPPFKWDSAQLEALCAVLKRFSTVWRPFEVQLRNFSAFPPRVLYVDVAENHALIQIQSVLESTLAAELRLRPDRPYGFRPHMTVAHKDLKREDFPAAWNYFSQQRYERIFQAEGLTLLRYSGARWELFHTFSFG